MRIALKNFYTPFENAIYDRIKVWEIEGYLDENALLALDPNHTPIYNGVPINKIEARRRIITYFQIPFDSNNVDTIHLIVKLRMKLRLVFAKPVKIMTLFTGQSSESRS